MVPVYYAASEIILGQFGIHSTLWMDNRPGAYFSESTWLAAFCVPVIGLIGYLRMTRQIGNAVAWINGALSCAILVSARSFNAIIGFLVLAGLVVWFSRRIRITAVFAAIIVSVSSLLLLGSRLRGASGDLSLIGRLQGFQLLIETADLGRIFGQGFGFDYSADVLWSGAAIGAKAFSLPFQLLYVGGWVLVLTYAYLLVISVLEDLKGNRFVGASLLVCFGIMSCFAPLAQGIVGIVFLWTRMCIKTESRTLPSVEHVV